MNDYITQYKTKALNRDIDLAVRAFGLDKRLLVEILSHGKVTESNLNEFGRFDKLIKSVDDSTAKEYLEKALDMTLSTIGYRTRLSTVLKEFLFSGGNGEKIPKIELPKASTIEWGNAEQPQYLMAAEGESTDET